MIRVLLAEDQAMVRGALSALLSREKDCEVQEMLSHLKKRAKINVSIFFT